MTANGFDSRERSVLRALTTPEKIQRFLDSIGYNNEKSGPTCRSPRRVLRDHTAQCIEGALFGAAALRVNGFPPLVLDLEANDRDDDHVIAIYRQHGHWGAVAKSNFAGLRFREPVYRNLRELAMSYFEHYFNLDAEKTLRTYSRPVNLARFDRIEWMTAERDLWDISDYLFSIPHRPLLPAPLARRLYRVDPRLFAAGCLGHVPKVH